MYVFISDYLGSYLDCKSIYYFLTKQLIGGGNLHYKTFKHRTLTYVIVVTRRFATRSYHFTIILHRCFKPKKGLVHDGCTRPSKSTL